MSAVKGFTCCSMRDCEGDGMGAESGLNICCCCSMTGDCLELVSTDDMDARLLELLYDEACGCDGGCISVCVGR